MTKLPARTIPRTGIAIPALGFGGGALGGMYDVVGEDDAVRAVRRAHAAGIRYFDTAPLYGHGRSEQRLGQGLKHFARDDYVLATKVGIMIKPENLPQSSAERRYADPWVIDGHYDFSYDACLRSLEASMERLGVDRVDVVNVHDPDEGESALPPDQRRDTDHLKEVMEGAYRALHELREQGVIKAIGVGMNGAEELEAFARAGEFDALLLAGRYTLLEQNGLDGLLPLCVERRIALIIGGVFNSGILATGTAGESPWHNYAPAEAGVLEHVRRIECLCEKHRVPLSAAALQFPLLHPAVACVIPGMRSADEVDRNVAAFDTPIGDAFWNELLEQGLIKPAADPALRRPNS